MSRIGKQPIIIPEKTVVEISADGTVTVRGPLGTLERRFSPAITISVREGFIETQPHKEDRMTKALWGTYASHLRNMVHGVNEPFQKKLVVEGVGYRSETIGKQVKLQLGFSHPVLITVPETLTVVAEKNVITITGSDKEEVGEFAARVRAVKKPEPYKGKGIRYDGEVVRRKQGKKNV